MHVACQITDAFVDELRAFPELGDVAEADGTAPGEDVERFCRIEAGPEDGTRKDAGRRSSATALMQRDGQWDVGLRVAIPMGVEPRDYISSLRARIEVAIANSPRLARLCSEWHLGPCEWFRDERAGRPEAGAVMTYLVRYHVDANLPETPRLNY